MDKPGDRVFAVLSANNTQVELLGFGVYRGDEEPPEEVAGMPPGSGWTNPALELDNGTVVWGCQCWWGGEARWEDFVGGREVINVEPHE